MRIRWYRYHVFRVLDSEKITVLRTRSVMTAIKLAAKLNFIAIKDDQSALYSYEELP